MKNIYFEGTNMFWEVLNRREVTDGLVHGSEVIEVKRQFFGVFDFESVVARRIVDAIRFIFLVWLFFVEHSLTFSAHACHYL